MWAVLVLRAAGWPVVIPKTGDRPNKKQKPSAAATSSHISEEEKSEDDDDNEEIGVIGKNSKQ